MKPYQLRKKRSTVRKRIIKVYNIIVFLLNIIIPLIIIYFIFYLLFKLLW